MLVDAQLKNHLLPYSTERQLMKLSVIIPQALTDSRYRFEYVESWCQQRDVSAEDYEIVIPVNATDESAVLKFRELVRPHDRVVPFRGENVHHYHEAGADAARGKWLLFTEDHVVADEYCVSRTLEFLDRTNAGAVLLKSKHICPNRCARHEGELFDRQIGKLWVATDGGDKVHMRGFVIDRDVLRQAGGLPWNYGLFCSHLLAVRLRQLSIPIEYCDAALIHHVNTTTLSELHGNVRDFIENEYRFRFEDPDDAAKRLLDPSPVLDQCRLWNREILRRAAILSARTIFTNLVTHQRGGLAVSRLTLAASAIRWRLSAWLGQRIFYWRAAWQLFRSRLRYSVIQYSAARGNYAFEAVWNDMGHYERARYCVNHPLPHTECDDVLVSDSETQTQFVGFHAVEEWCGRRFRWSEPVAALLLDLAQEKYCVCIDTGGIRGMDCAFPFQLVFNGVAIESSELEIHQGCLRFELSPESFSDDSVQSLLILVSPLKFPKETPADSRKLGMPIQNITFRPASVAESCGLKAA